MQIEQIELHDLIEKSKKKKTGNKMIVGFTINQFLKENKEPVMGAGTAKIIAEKFPKIKKELGNKLDCPAPDYIHHFAIDGIDLIAFTVKPSYVKAWKDRRNIVPHMRDEFYTGQLVPGWAARAQVNLIMLSLNELNKFMSAHPEVNVYLPLPGCGAGELNWEQTVRPLIEDSAHPRIKFYTKP